MALPERFSLLHSELNGFLFATMGTEENGAPLSVLSALTRLGIDPWIEGARLARLPRSAAARAISALIALLPRDRSESDVRELADHLAGLLPRPRARNAHAATLSAGAWRTRWPALWLFCLGLALLVAALVAARGL